jgi:hypothetical protein
MFIHQWLASVNRQFYSKRTRYPVGSFDKTRNNYTGCIDLFSSLFSVIHTQPNLHKLLAVSSYKCTYCLQSFWTEAVKTWYSTRTKVEHSSNSFTRECRKIYRPIMFETKTSPAVASVIETKRTPHCNIYLSHFTYTNDLLTYVIPIA